MKRLNRFVVAALAAVVSLGVAAAVAVAQQGSQGQPAAPGTQMGSGYGRMMPGGPMSGGMGMGEGQMTGAEGGWMGGMEMPAMGMGMHGMGMGMGMGGCGGMAALQNDPKRRGRMMELRGEMMRLMGDAMVQRGKELQKSK